MTGEDLFREIGKIDNKFIPVSYTHLDVYKRQMYLFIDGARLAYALASEKNALDFNTIAAN